MFGVKDLAVELLTDSPVLVALSLIVLVALSVYIYRRTNPPLPRWLRLTLGGLRITAVILLFLALFEPVVSYTHEYVRPRRIAVVLDESLSMNKVENERPRRSRADSLLSGATYENLTRTTEVSTYFFGGSLDRSPGKIDSTRTALGDALFELDKLQMAEPHDYWLVVTDGNSNSGRKPLDVAPSLSTPVISIDITGGQGSFDIGVGEVEFNPVMFVGRPAEIRVRLNWRNAEGKTIDVRLIDSVRTVDDEQLAVTQEGGIGEVTLRYVPDVPGQKLLSISVPPQENEESIGNNSRTISVKVLKSRMMVLVVSDAPDYEVGFLKRLLSGSDRYEVDLLATGGKAGNLGGRFPSAQTELNRYDLIILHDPDPADYNGRQEILQSYLAERGGALWVMMGPQFAARGPVPWFNDLLPFCQTGAMPVQYVDQRADPMESHLFHPAIRLADDQSTIRETWAALPPFEVIVLCDSVAADGVVLAESSRRNPEGAPPALGYRRHGPGKVFASAVLPFWPWGFVNLGFGEDDAGYRRFIEGTVGWLTVKDDFEPIRVKPEKEVFTRGEPVAFHGFAFDLGYRPLPGVTGAVELTGGPENEEFQRDLVGVGEGNFRAAFDNLAPGRYTYAARMEKENQVLRVDSGAILIESFSLEEFDQSGDPATLAALSQATGGTYYTYDQFDRVLNDLSLEEVTLSNRREFSFWNQLWMLIALIGALSLEWFLRKANQLV